MSAFMVEDTTINNVVTFLVYDRDNGQWIRQQLASQLGLYSPEDVGKAMFALNVAGVEARYGKGEAETFRPLDYKYEPIPGVNKFQALKSLHCWNYQCSEGDVPQTPLYKIMAEYSDLIAYSIISDMPEYEQAKWG